MAVVEFLYQDIKKLADYPQDKIVETLTNIGAPSEADGERIITEITPNRPDLFFIEGAARAVRAYLEGKTTEYKTEKSKFAIICDKSVDKVRPIIRFAAVTGVQFDAKTMEYLIEAQEKLHETIGRKRKKVAIGIHDLDLIEFPLIYRAVEDVRFVPLGFDAEMSAMEICEKHPKGVQYAHLVKGGKYPMIFDRKGVISFPPIINSERTKLTENTKNLLIDVTGTHKETVEAVLNMLVCALAEHGGTIHEIKVNGEPYPKLSRMKTAFDIRGAQKILGVQLKKTELPNLLSKMDLKLKGSMVLTPPYRSDIIHDVDVTEDIAIAYGYDRFEPTLPGFFTSGKLIDSEAIGTIMRSMGFSEVKTFTLTNKNQISQSGIGTEENLVVKNPASEEYSVLRPSLLPSVLEILENNKTKGLPQKIYEIGVAYPGGKAEKRVLFGIMDRTTDFSAIRGVLQTLMNEFGIRFELEKNRISGPYDAEKSGVVVCGGRKIGLIGEISQSAIDRYGFEFKIVVCELDCFVFVK